MAPVTKVLATDLRASDKIVVSISAVKNGEGRRTRLPVGLTFDGLGRQFNQDGTISATLPRLTVPGAGGGTPPTWDDEGFREALRTGNRAEADAIAAAYQAAQDAFEVTNGAGGGTLGQRIGNAVVDFIVAQYGVKTTDAPDGVIVRREEVIVKPVYRYNDAPTTFIVAMAPVWGSCS